MDTEVRFRITNRLKELEKIAAVVRDFAAANRLSQKDLYLANLVLDEVVTNVISYGYPDDDEHVIDICVSLEDDFLVFEVIDDGRPFSIKSAPPVNVHQPLEQRPIGGLGCHLVINLMDKVDYRRRAGKNHLILKKTLSDKTSPADDKKT